MPVQPLIALFVPAHTWRHNVQYKGFMWFHSSLIQNINVVLTAKMYFIKYKNVG